MDSKHIPETLERRSKFDIHIPIRANATTTISLKNALYIESIGVNLLLEITTSAAFACIHFAPLSADRQALRETISLVPNLKNAGVRAGKGKAAKLAGLKKN